MSTTSIALSALLPPKGNPRKTYNKASIEGLARTIKTDGLIQNLTVRPEKDGRYRVVIGKRRFLALDFLRRGGEIQPSYRVPIRVRKGASQKVLDRLSTVENVQREPLDPIDEADAFAGLLKDGEKIEDVSAETGVSVQTIRRRLALAALIPEAKQAVREKSLTLSVAAALTLAPSKEQKEWLRIVRRNGGYDAHRLRSMLLDEKPSAAIAIFPLEKYEGTITSDLFADKGTTYFDDREAFMRLQAQAVEDLAAGYRKTSAWVEVISEAAAPWWQFRDGKKKEQRGVVIHFSPTGRVEVRKDLVRNKVEPKAPPRKAKPQERPEWSKPTIRYANAQRSVAVQAALLSNPRKAKEAAACLLMTASTGSGIKLRPHDSLRDLAKAPASSKAYGALEGTCRSLLEALGMGKERSADNPAWLQLLHLSVPWSDLLAALASLSEQQLDLLIATCLALTVGSESMESPDKPGTPYACLASLVPVDLRAVWTPDTVFLGGLRRDQLVKIAAETGAARQHTRLVSAGKRELVEGLATWFARTADPLAAQDEHAAKARVWLPGCMRASTVSAST